MMMLSCDDNATMTREYQHREIVNIHNTFVTNTINNSIMRIIISNRIITVNLNIDAYYH